MRHLSLPTRGVLRQLLLAWFAVVLMLAVLFGLGLAGSVAPMYGQ